jgi:hypothetical protein
VRPRLLRIAKPVAHNAPRIMHFADMREAVDPRIPSFQKIHAHPAWTHSKIKLPLSDDGLVPQSCFPFAQTPPAASMPSSPAGRRILRTRPQQQPIEGTHLAAVDLTHLTADRRARLPALHGGGISPGIRFGGAVVGTPQEPLYRGLSAEKRGGTCQLPPPPISADA